MSTSCLQKTVYCLHKDIILVCVKFITSLSLFIIRRGHTRSTSIDWILCGCLSMHSCYRFLQYNWSILQIGFPAAEPYMLWAARAPILIGDGCINFLCSITYIFYEYILLLGLLHIKYKYIISNIFSILCSIY